VRSKRGTPRRYFVLTVTVTEAQRELHLDHPDVVYRLARAGVLKSRKFGRVWDIDPASVRARKRYRSEAIEQVERGS
jgi:hypothetical protein